MLQDESLEYIREQFEEKNMVLEQFGERVSPWTFYEDIFGDLSQVFPVVILGEDQGKRVVPMMLEEAIEWSADRNDMLLGGVSYFNNWISKKSAKDLYCMIVDIDNVYSGTLLNALQRDWYSANGEYIPKPTYLVNSGTGCHAVFVLTEEIPVYGSSRENLDKVYRALAEVQTTKRAYLRKQIQWWGQTFRFAGGRNKYNWENTIFRVGEKWDIDDLAEAVGVHGVHFPRHGEKRMQKPLQQPRTRKVRTGRKVNRAFYDYALRGCREKTMEGHRYMSMCALSVIAYKCGVSADELEKDLLALLPEYNRGAKRLVKESEIYSAMKMYSEKALLTPRESLETWQGWNYTPIKRNGQTQREHLEEARMLRDLRMKRQGRTWRNEKGAPSKREIVVQWRKEHPNGKKIDAERDLGISQPTLRKYWNCAVDD